MLFISYLEFFHKLHVKYLKRFTSKMNLITSQINHDIQLDTPAKTRERRKTMLAEFKEDNVDSALLSQLADGLSIIDSDDDNDKSDIKEESIDNPIKESGINTRNTLMKSSKMSVVKHATTSKFTSTEKETTRHFLGSSNMFPKVDDVTPIATDTIIEDGPLLIDMGAKYKGYCSDFTRTFWVGKKTDDYEEFIKVYSSVKKASIKATLWARVGMKASQIDALARKSIIKDGYWDYFSHSTGHGVWLNIHEGPWITQMSDDKIKTGMMFTIEPWIYLPGKFGVRIENIVLAKEERIKCVSKIRY